MLEQQTPEEKKEIVRQIHQKKIGLNDMEWVEICQRYNLDISAETLRKAGVGIKLASDAHMLNEESELDATDDYNDYIDRQKIRDLTSQLNGLLRSESRSQLLRETIQEVAERMPKIPPMGYVPRGASCNGEKEKTLLLTLGDFHYGAKIKVEGLYGEVLNRYDSEVFEQRMEKLLDETVDILMKEHVDQVVVFLVGDLLDGMLRQSQLMRLEYGLVDSTMQLSEFLAQWLLALSKYARIEVYSTTGNHSEIRPLKSKNREFEDENLERVIMWYLGSRLNGKSDVYVDTELRKMKMVDIYDFKFLLLHGDGEKNIDQIAKDTVNQYEYSIDFFVCGHKHKETEYPAGTTNSGNSTIIRVPSLCGVDHYAQSKGYGGKAGAIASVIERGYGRRCVYPIRLS